MRLISLTASAACIDPGEQAQDCDPSRAYSEHSRIFLTNRSAQEGKVYKPFNDRSGSVFKQSDTGA